MWHDDDSDLASYLLKTNAWFNEIISISPILGYHPEAAKSFLVTSVGNMDLAKALCIEGGF